MLVQKKTKSKSLTTSSPDETISVKKDVLGRRNMKMTTKGQYALVALTHMRKVGGETPIRLQDIAKVEKISIHYLEQLFRKLRVAGIVESVRGPGGGYRFTQRAIKEGAKTRYVAKEVSYKDVLEAVGESISFRSSLEDKSKASNDVIVNLNKTYDELSKAFEATKV